MLQKCLRKIKNSKSLYQAVDFWHADLDDRSYPSLGRPDTILFALHVKQKVITCKVQAITMQNITRKQFLGEMLYTSSLSHPNIVKPIYHAIWEVKECKWRHKTQPLIRKLLSKNAETTHVFFIAMETGKQDLFEIVATTSLTKKQKLRYTIQMLKILYYLHSKGWIHGDFKLENLILFKDDIKLIDMGNLSTVYAPGWTVTTQRYRGPEGTHTHAASQPLDLWGLGVCVYMLWTKAEIPWFRHPDRVNERLLQHLVKTEAWLPHGHLPVSISALLRGLFQLEPDKRWSAAQSLSLFDKKEICPIDLTLTRMNHHLREEILLLVKSWKRALQSEIPDPQLVFMAKQLYNCPTSSKVNPTHYVKLLGYLREGKLETPFSQARKNIGELE